MVLLVSYGSVVAPAATIRGSIAVSVSFEASTTTRMLPASISSWKLRRIGSGRDEPTSAEAQQPTTAPATVVAAAPARVTPSGGIATATRPASNPAPAP